MHSSHYAFSSLPPPIRRVGYLFATAMKLPVLFASVPVRLISDMGRSRALAGLFSPMSTSLSRRSILLCPCNVQVSLCDGAFSSPLVQKVARSRTGHATETTEISVLLSYPPSRCYAVQTSAVVGHRNTTPPAFQTQAPAWRRPTRAEVRVRTTTSTLNRDDKRVAERSGAEHSSTVSRITS